MKHPPDDQAQPNYAESTPDWAGKNAERKRSRRKRKPGSKPHRAGKPAKRGLVEALNRAPNVGEEQKETNRQRLRELQEIGRSE